MSTADPPTAKQRPRKPMLARWGIIPVILFVVVQIRFGWAEAMEKASAPRFAPSYFMGGILAGPLFSLLAAWVAYRVFRRSQRVASITFCLMLILCSVSVVMRNSAAPSPVAARQASQPGLHNFPLAGITIGTLADWDQLPPDRPSIVTRWIHSDQRSRAVDGMIMVELKKPGLKDARDIAISIATDWGGRVADGSESMDGEIAWHILSDKPHSDIQPVEGFVAIHQGRLYMIEGGVVPNVSCHEQVEAIRQGWKWIPLESPAMHLEFLDQPVPAIQDQILINYPGVMQPFDMHHPDRGIGLEIIDIQRDAQDFSAIVELTAIPEG